MPKMNKCKYCEQEKSMLYKITKVIQSKSMKATTTTFYVCSECLKKELED